jgi:hypothetical protein
MSPRNNRTITAPGKGFFSDLGTRVKLILRLMGDRRVSPILKVLPVASMVYLVFPDIVPLFLDDAAVVWLGTSLFVELCPQAVVKEHMDDLRRVVPLRWNDTDDDAVDAEFKDTSREGTELPRTKE